MLLALPGCRFGVPPTGVSKITAAETGRVTIQELAIEPWCRHAEAVALARPPYSSELRKMALAHTIANKVDAAYRRGEALDKAPGNDGSLGGAGSNVVEFKTPAGSAA